MNGWIRVGALEAIPEGGSLRIELRDEAVRVFRRGSRVFALSERCPHAGGRLQDSLVEDRFAVCPDHGYAFDAETGRCRALRSLFADTLAARIREGEVWIRA